MDTCPSPPRGVGALSELAELLLATQTFENPMPGVAELSVRAVDTATTCGITLAQDGRVLTVAGPAGGPARRAAR